MKMNLLSLAAILMLVLISWDQSPKFAYADLIGDTCNKTSDTKLCVSILRSNPQSATADVRGLVLIMLEYWKAYVEDTLALSKKLFQGEKNPSVKEGLSTCVDVYDLGVYRAGEVIDFVKAKNYRSARDNVYTIAVDASTCRDVVTGTPLTIRNNVVTNTTNLATTMIDILV